MKYMCAKFGLDNITFQKVIHFLNSYLFFETPCIYSVPKESIHFLNINNFIPIISKAMIFLYVITWNIKYHHPKNRWNWSLNYLPWIHMHSFYFFAYFLRTRARWKLIKVSFFSLPHGQHKNDLTFRKYL